MKTQGIAAIVTGAGSGLGAATARALARNGARVALLDINRTQNEQCAGEIGGLALHCDVTDDASARSAVSQAAASHGEARILVNCAGVADAGRIVGREEPHDLALFRKVIEINLIGTFNLMRLFAERASKLDPFEDGERAVIISTASVAAF